MASTKIEGYRPIGMTIDEVDQWYVRRNGVWDNWGATAGATWNTANWATTGTVSTPTWTLRYDQDDNTARQRVWHTWTGATTTPFRIQDPIHVWTETQTNVWQQWRTQWVYEQRVADPYRTMETPEARQERLDREQREREERNARRLAAQKRAQGAEQRAEELLRMVLSDEHLEQYERDGKITVLGSEGGLYLLDTRYGYSGSVHGNIAQVDEHGCVLARLCVAPGMYDRETDLALPLQDGYVGQYLGLRFNEADFVAHANWSRRAACRHPDVPILGAPTRQVA